MSSQIGTAHPQFGYEAPWGPAQPRPRPLPGTNGLAIASLVVSIHSIGVPGLGVVGAILGHVSKSQLRRSGEDGDTMATAGIAIGWGITALYALLFVGFVLLVLAS